MNRRSHLEPAATVAATLATTDLQFLEQQSTSAIPDMRVAVASNPHVTRDLLWKMYESELHQDVFRAIALARGKHTSNDFWIMCMYDQLLPWVLSNPDIPPNLLDKHNYSQSTRVRRVVAANPSTPTVTLIGMADDGDFEVRRAVHSNQNCDPIDLALLNVEFGPRR